MKTLPKTMGILALRLFTWGCLILCLNCKRVPKNISEPVQAHTQTESIKFTDEVIPKTLQLSSKVLSVFKITRKRAEMRRGPGIEFPLSEQILTKDDLLVKIYQHKFWYKVIHMKSGQSGWIHKKTANNYKGKEILFSIESRSLQNAFVSKKNAHILNFANRNILPNKPKKGQILKVLQRKGPLLLIYIPSNNSVAWIRRSFTK